MLYGSFQVVKGKALRLFARLNAGGARRPCVLQLLYCTKREVQVVKDGRALQRRIYRVLALNAKRDRLEIVILRFVALRIVALVLYDGEEEAWVSLLLQA